MVSPIQALQRKFCMHSIDATHISPRPLHLIILTTFGKEYNSLSSSLRRFVADSVRLVQRVPYQGTLEGFGDFKIGQVTRTMRK
jgi:hypothetical protein